MRPRRRCGNRVGSLCAAFGAGLIVASCMPNTFIIFVMAAVLIILGISVCRI